MHQTRRACRSLVAIVLLLAAMGCSSQPSSSPSSTPLPSTQPSVSINDFPLLYHRTGGIAGTDDRVVIWPDGFIQVHGKLMGDAEGTLPPSRLEKLRTLVKEYAKPSEGFWSVKGSVSPTIPDAYIITIFSAGKREEVDDIAAQIILGKRFVDIYMEVEAIAAETVNASTKPEEVP